MLSKLTALGTVLIPVSPIGFVLAYLRIFNPFGSDELGDWSMGHERTRAWSRH